MQRVVVHGASTGTQGLLQMLIMSLLDLQVGCYEPDETLVDVAGLTALSQISSRAVGCSCRSSDCLCGRNQSDAGSGLEPSLCRCHAGVAPTG